MALGLHAETNDQSGEGQPFIPVGPCSVPALHLQELLLGSAAVTQGALDGVVGGSKDGGHQAGVVQRGCMVQRAGEEEEGGSAGAGPWGKGARATIFPSLSQLQNGRPHRRGAHQHLGSSPVSPAASTASFRVERSGLLLISDHTVLGQEPPAWSRLRPSAPAAAAGGGGRVNKLLSP